MSNDRITKEDKIDFWRNEQKLKRGDRQATTYHQLAQVDFALDNVGRHAQPTALTGEQKAAQYPAASAPWTAQADPGVEPPLGVAIDAIEPCGEFFEVERSLEEIGGPEPGAITQSRVPYQQLQSAVEGLGPPPELEAEDKVLPNTCPERPGSAIDAPSSVSSNLAEAQAPLEVPSSASGVETASANPPDGLDDVPRRADGWPLSSHAHAPLKKRKVT